MGGKRFLCIFLFSTFTFADVLVEVQPSDLTTRYKSYRATVDRENNDFALQPALERLGIALDKLPGIIPAEQLLSDYAREWAYKHSGKPGQNCWHTAIASVFKGWKKARRMNGEEFLCHLKHSFEEIKAPEKWGDVISFASKNGEPVHGFVYLGPDRANPDKQIVFTKNGYAPGHFLFMTYDDVYKVYQYYDTQVVTYHRPINIAVDPSEDPKSPCYDVYLNGRWAPDKYDIADPLQPH